MQTQQVMKMSTMTSAQIKVAFKQALHPKYDKLSAFCDMWKEQVDRSLEELNLKVDFKLCTSNKKAVSQLESGIKNMVTAREKRYNTILKACEKRAKEQQQSEKRIAKSKTTPKAKATPKPKVAPKAKVAPVVVPVVVQDELREAKATALPAEANPFADYFKFKVVSNDKTPAGKWTQPDNQTKNNIKGKFNTGIPTGARNNLLVVDLDVKDDGIDEFQKYLDQHGNINTLIVETPSQGQHYYFNFSHASPETKKIIDTYLKTASKYRGKGIDIRSNGGYIVAPPSVRDGKAYKVINQTKPIDIPESLVKWLLEGKGEQTSTRPSTRPSNNKQYNYDITEDKLRDIIFNLDEKYLHNYSDWLIVTSVLKCHDMHDLWDEWSQQSDKYNKAKNEKEWQYNKGVMDIFLFDLASRR